MALDFPASPTNGQLDPSGQWIYNSSKLAWQSVPLTQGKTVTSPTPPSSPQNGDQWFNTNDGTLYIYYTDANTSQWVESRAPITADGYQSPNYVINGGMDIWQRGTSSSSLGGTGYFVADRWGFTYGSGSTGTLSQSTDVPSGIGVRYSLSMAMSASTSPKIYTRIEAADSSKLSNKIVTISFYAKSTVGSETLTLKTYYPSAVDNFSSITEDMNTTFTLTSTWQRFTYTATPNSGISNGYQILLQRNTAASTASTTLITGVQLEEGSVATPFRRNANSIQGELAACQRYYWRITAQNTWDWFSNGQVYSSVLLIFPFQFPVTMRAVPSTTVEWSGSLSGFVARSGASTLTLTSTPVVASDSDGKPSPNMIQMYWYVTGAGANAGATARLISNNNGSYIGFSAEL